LRRTVAGGSRYIFDHLQVGKRVGTSDPRNNFRFESAGAYLFVAGGIGITPLRPMIRQAASRGDDWHLVYGGRTLESMAYVDELQREFPDHVDIVPEETRGQIDLGTYLTGASPETLVYGCGPEGMLSALETLGAVHSSAVRVERFVPRVGVDLGASTAFDVELVRSGLVLTVGAGESILNAVTRVGVDVESSCSEGTCGSCETAVLGGTPDHRDSVLSPDEQAANDIMMICVSRSCGPRLSLDL
jgi:ferredoxin-NADP reductase